MLDRFAHGDLGDDDLSAVLAHLETCPSCAQAGRQHIRRDVSALRAELTARPAAQSRRTIVWSLAAAAVLAAAILAALLFPRKRQPKPSLRPPVVRDQTPPRVAPAPPATTQKAASYANPQWQQLVARAEEANRLAFPADLADLQRSEDVVRGTTSAIDRVSPSAIVIDEVRPTFTWPARPEGTCVVYVFDEKQREVVRSPSLEQARWTPDRDLPRGRTLSWQVEVTGGGTLETIPRPPTPPAVFRIVSQTDHEDLERAKTLHPNDPLLHAVLYAHTGMRAEALASLEIAARRDETARRILDHENALPR